jgi:prephenate dehydrogenase
MRIALLGFGLIGGSIAHALRASPDRDAWSVTAWSPTGRGPAQAASDGVVARSAGTPEEALDGAQLVVLAAPPTATLDLVDRLGGPLRSVLDAGTVVTDVASTKGAIVAAAARHGLRFVGGHPMAGRETSGYGSATTGLFGGRPWVVTPADPADAAATLAVETLAVACGARPVRLDATAHDELVAAISHLPLVLAAALTEAVAGTLDEPRADWPAARALAATGWRDMTRLARGDAAMGAGIAATNPRALAARIRDVRRVLDDWLAELERPDGPDEAPLAARLEAARTVLERPG